MLILARRRQRQRLVHASAHSKLAATLDVEKMKADPSDDSENNEKDAEGIDEDSTVTSMGLSQRKSRLSIPRILLFSLSFVSLVICLLSGAAHYRKADWGDSGHPIGWLLSMLFLLLAFLPIRNEIATGLKSLIKPKTAFFLFWILFFVVSHLWNFRTAPWNGDALFDESGWDLWYLKTYVIGHPYQPAWFHIVISRETLFHYYVWGFLKLFGFNILSYQAALFVIWLTTFVFTLLLVDLFFRSYIVTSITALAFNFLPFAFIYTFAGYRYPMAVALAVVSLYFLYLGSRTASPFYLSLGGIAAGLCLASSISGKQYLLALGIAAPLYAVFNWRSLTRTVTWTSLAVVVYGFAAAATPILLYIVFNHGVYTLYESSFVHAFWDAARRPPFPTGIKQYTKQLYDCFFSIGGPRFFIPETLPIPLPYYWLLIPGAVLALWQKRFEIVLLAIIPVVGAFIAGAIENRLLLPIPFWVILMSFTFAGILKLRQWPSIQIVLGAIAVLILLDGLAPSIRYIYSKTKSPFSIHFYAQEEVAVSRFLKYVVAGQEHPDSPRLERDEFNRIKGIPDPRYDTFICVGDAYSIIHLFLHDYDDEKILSFCGGYPFDIVLSEQDVWNGNKRAILSYAPSNKDLKLIWERRPKTERIISMLQSLRDLGTEDSISYAFGGRVRTFYVLNIANNNIREFQERVSELPDTPVQATSGPVPGHVADMFKGGKGAGKGKFDSPTGIAVARNGDILVADTGNGRIQKFSPNGIFVASIGQFEAPNGIAIDHAGNIYVAEVGSKHRVQKLASDGTFIAEWKGPDTGFYGPRRIAIGPDDSIYVVDSGRNRIVKFRPDFQVLASWGSEGSGDGQFKGLSSVAADPINNKVYVADPINKRIQVFDSDGKFLTKWSVPEWEKPLGCEDLAIDSKASRLYASSAHMDTVLVFDLNGTKIGTLTPKPPDRLGGPSALALSDRKLYVLDMAANRVSEIDL
jgi:DNA-binding beta-propeller fold protein YncE